MLELMKKFMKDEEGQDLVEYALLLVFLALAAIAILPTLGSSVNSRVQPVQQLIERFLERCFATKSSGEFTTGLFFCCEITNS